MDITEFKKSVKKVLEKRNHLVRNSVGVYDIYKHIRKNKWYSIPRPLKEGEFYRIIRHINLLLADELLKGKEIKLPHSLGSIELRKRPTKISIVDGKLVTTLPIDWDKTLELWGTDRESYENRTLVRVESREVFRVYYNKTNANFTNKSFYEFRPTREIKNKITQAANYGHLDAFLIDKYYDKDY